VVKPATQGNLIVMKQLNAQRGDIIADRGICRSPQYFTTISLTLSGKLTCS
jgi:hypothetical protein